MPEHATKPELDAHAAAADPHAGYRLESAAIGTADLADNAVTLAKLADIATARLLGRTTAGSGDPEELTAAQARTLLSLVVGTNVQAWSTHLDTVAALAAAKRMLRVNAAGNGLEFVNPMASVPAALLSEVTFDTSTAENTLTTLAIPTWVGAGDLVRVSLIAEFLNNTGANVNFTYRFKIGSTTVIDTGALVIGTSSSSRKTKFEFLTTVVSSSSQRSMLTMLTAAGAGATLSTSASVLLYGASTEDTTVSKNVVVTAQMGTSSANASVTAHAATLEVVRAL